MLGILSKWLHDYLRSLIELVDLRLTNGRWRYRWHYRWHYRWQGKYNFHLNRQIMNLLFLLLFGKETV